jgi:PAS domain S-box-containing protein
VIGLALDTELARYVLPLLAATLISASVSLYAFRHRRSPGALGFGCLMAGLAEWTLCYAFELSASDLPTKFLWSQLNYPGTLLTVVAWVVVALDYSGRGRLVTRRNLMLASIVPVLTLGFVATSPLHRWFWTGVELDPGSPALIAQHGPWFWVHLSFCYVALSVGAVLILRRVFQSPQARNWQTASLLTSVLVPWIWNFLHVFGFTHSRVDPTPYALTLSGLALTLGVFRFRLLDIVPLARDAVIDGMADGMLVLDLENRVVDLNPAASALLGARGRAAIGRPADEVLGAWPRLAEQWHGAMEGQTEVALREGDSLRRYDVRISPLRLRQADPGGRVFVFRDVTEARAAEEERQALHRAASEERGRLLALIRASHDGIVLFGQDQRFLVVNQAALGLLALPARPEDWLGRRLKDALTLLRDAAPAAAEAAEDELRRIRRGDEPAAEGEYILPPRTVRWHNLPVAADSTPLGRLLVLRDVTQERAIERLRSDLTHTMVHDLRNPLTAILGTLDLLQGSGSLSGHQHEIIRVARSGAQIMVNLVNAILDVSQLESGRMPLEREPLSLLPLVAETLDLHGPLARDRRLLLLSDVPAAHPPVWADSRLVSRILQNLVGNSIKFAAEGGSIRVSALPDSASMLRVAVSDDGPGISTELRERLFQKFATGDVKGRGTGLGLAFCRLAVEAHGGRIWVDSQPGQGSTFSFTLPVSPQ